MITKEQIEEQAEKYCNENRGDGFEFQAFTAGAEWAAAAFEFDRVLTAHANEMLQFLQDIATPKRGSEQEFWSIEDAAAAAASILSRMNASISE